MSDGEIEYRITFKPRRGELRVTRRVTFLREHMAASRLSELEMLHAISENSAEEFFRLDSIRLIACKVEQFIISGEKLLGYKVGSWESREWPMHNGHVWPTRDA